MKIISVRFANLNSLRGEHHIVFDAAPLADTGLFLITGETGSGKTTILDAITVALYGRAARYESGKPDSLMAQHTGECYSEVEFESGGKRYRSKWSLARAYKKPNGALQPDKMEVAVLENGSQQGVLLTQKKSDVPDTIIEISGLSYQQFLRSVMLAQGKFAEFLKANEKERGALLEQMTGTEEYSQISIAAFQQAKSANEQLQYLESSLGGVALLSDEERKTAIQTNTENLEKSKTLETDIITLQTALHWKRGITELEEELFRQTHNVTEAQANVHSFASEQQRLEQHSKALPFQKDFGLLDNNLNERRNLQEDISQTETTALPEAQQTSQIRHNGLLEAENIYNVSKQTLAVAQQVFEEVLQLDAVLITEQTQLEQEQQQAAIATAEAAEGNNTLKQRRDELSETHSKVEKLAVWLQDHVSDKSLEPTLPLIRSEIEQWLSAQKTFAETFEEVQKNEKKLHETTEFLTKTTLEHSKVQKTANQLTETLNDLQTKLENLVEGKSLGELDENLDTIKDEGITIAEQIALVTQINEKKEELQTLNKDIISYAETMTSLHEDQKKLQTTIEQEEEKRTLAQRALDHARLIAKYEDDRKRLQKGAECPLCGSNHHPFAEHTPSVNENEDERVLKDIEKKLKTLSKKMTEITAKLSSLETEHTNAKTNITKLQKELSQQKEKFDILNEQRQTSYLPDIPALEAAQIIKREEYKRLKDRKTTFDKLQKKLNSEQKTLDGIKETLNQFNTTISVAESQRTTLKSDKPTLQNRMETAHNALERCNAMLTGRCNVFGENSPTDSQTAENLVQRLEQRAGKYKKQNDDEQTLRGNAERLQAGMEELQKTCLEKEVYAKKLQGQVRGKEEQVKKLQQQREEKFGAKQVAEERSRLEQSIVEAEHLLGQAQRKAEEARTALHALETSLVEHKRRLEQLIDDENNIRRKILTQAKVQGFQSIEQIRTTLLPDYEVTRLENLSKTLSDSLLKEQTTLRDIQKRLVVEQEKNLLVTTSVEEVQSQLEAKSLEHQTVLQNIGALQQVLTNDEEQKQKHAEFAAKCAEQRIKTSRWQQLSNLIGSAEGDKFRKFAQGLTLARLVQLANKRLLRLNERYTILKDTDTDLQLLIIDNEQAGVIRPMESLSGGETFMVSLALALGLSDLASRNMQIDSLFVDEGFGTLDAQTLEEVMRALENLRLNGKTIGIISHVEMLKERIPTQIQVKKRGEGISELQIFPIE